MPQMQWLGSLPEKRSYVGEALESGVESYWGARGKREERVREAGKQKMEERKMSLLEEDFKATLSKLEYSKKVDAANMVIKVKEMMDEEQAAEFDADPKAKMIFEDLGWKYPEGSLQGKGEIKRAAYEAVEQGEPLPGMTMEETKKAAGVYIAEKQPPKITGADVKATPWELADIIPWRESAKEKLERERMEQFKKKGVKGVRVEGGGVSDPLGVR